MKRMNKDTWKTILKLIVAIATAVLSTLGVQAMVPLARARIVRFAHFEFMS